MLYKILFSWVCLFVALGGLIAQEDTNKEDERNKPLGDTTQVHYYYIDRPTVQYRIDTTLRNFEKINASWRDQSDYWDLGNLGSPHFSPIYKTSIKAGFRVGMDQYKMNRLRREDIRYFNIESNRPFTDLYYSQVGQQNSYIRAEFAHQLIPDLVYFSLHYNLINYEGFFAHQKVRNQNFGLTVRANTKNRRYQGYFTFLTNALKNEINGGVEVDTNVYGRAKDFLVNVPVRTTSAQAQNRHTDLSYVHFLYNASVDSATGKTLATNAFEHRITYQLNRYKYYDKGPSESFYGTYYTNPRGIRHYIKQEIFENELSFRQAIGGNLSNAPVTLKAYLQHSWHFLNQQPEKTQIHNLFAGLIAEGRPEQAFRYKVKGQIGWAKQTWDYYVNGQVGYDFGKFGYVEGKALFQRYQPSLVERRILISWDEVWDNNDFKQVQELSFGGSYSLKRWGFRIEALNHTLNNLIYFDSVGVYQSQNQTINMLQLKLQQDIKVWRFHLDNEVVWQPVLSGANFFRFPELMLKHNLYFESMVFKKVVRLKVGASVRYNTNYKGYGYTPVIGQFYLQNERMLTFYPMIDVYLAAKIWQFKVFVTAENIMQVITGENAFPTVHNPYPNFLVRFGVGWRLFD
ncbi:MAG: putative porin [Aureispira sp.]|nr:putative porin [Aureispira sp.]